MMNANVLQQCQSQQQIVVFSPYDTTTYCFTFDEIFEWIANANSIQISLPSCLNPMPCLPQRHHLSADPGYNPPWPEPVLLGVLYIMYNADGRGAPKGGPGVANKFTTLGAQIEAIPQVGVGLAGILPKMFMEVSVTYRHFLQALKNPQARSAEENLNIQATFIHFFLLTIYNDLVPFEFVDRRLFQLLINLLAQKIEQLSVGSEAALKEAMDSKISGLFGEILRPMMQTIAALKNSHTISVLDIVQKATEEFLKLEAQVEALGGVPTLQ